MRTGQITTLLLVAGALVCGCGGSGTLTPTYDRIGVNVIGTGTGGGTVVAPDPSVPTNCTFPNLGVCLDYFDDAGGGGIFSLDATAAPGSVFVGWTGCGSPPSLVCNLSFSASSGDTTFNVTAQFDLLPVGGHPLAEIIVYNGTLTAGITATMQTPYDGPKSFGPIGANQEVSDSLQVEVGVQFQLSATVGAKSGLVTCTTAAGIIPDPNVPFSGSALASVFTDPSGNVTINCEGTNWH